MPKQYEAIRDQFVRKGMDYDEAQTRAAKIYNAKHPDKPVTGHSEVRAIKSFLKHRGRKHVKKRS